MKISMIIAFKDFKDEEYFVTKGILENAGVAITTVSNKIGLAVGAGGGDAQTDVLLENLDSSDFDAVIFIGGPGALQSLDTETSYALAKQTVSQGRILAAICISPVILAKAGALKGKKATVWSSSSDKWPIRALEENGAIYQAKSVVRDGKIITANGPAAAEEFAQEILRSLMNKKIYSDSMNN